MSKDCWRRIFISLVFGQANAASFRIVLAGARGVIFGTLLFRWRFRLAAFRLSVRAARLVFAIWAHLAIWLADVLRQAFCSII
jgi:hypothetical protein